ncbi:ClbS/DfsB family four-helix bundle protein [Vibrio maritimus]|uniref:ClbS/DfsB family four-helix bundle protein n=1 Tax=Vibrio maritimus TaxID=990268 RepID=UPI004069514D
MARPKTKEDLISQANEKFLKLFQHIESMSEIELNAEFDFSSERGLKSNGTVLYAKGVNCLIYQNILDSKNKG